MSKTFYHATGVNAVDRILSEGLTLPIGRVTSGSRLQPRIYLYKKYDDAYLHIPALYYLGAIPHMTPFAIFKVNLPASYDIFGDIEYSDSFFVTKTIPAGFLKLITTHSADYKEFEHINWDE